MATLALAGALAGCAGTITHMQDVSHASRQKAAQEFHQFDARKERQVGRSSEEQIAAVERVRQRIWPAAKRVCEQFFSHGCAESLNSIRVVVYTDNPEVNAYASLQGEVGMYGGLILETGTDDELAMVLSHEIAHVMYGHVQKSQSNTGGGMILGGLIGMALGAAIHQPGMDTGYIGDMAEGGMQAGGAIGAVAYSPEMELEADHFAAFVLKEAGYDPTKGGRFIVRSWRRSNADQVAGRKSFVSYFGTHPADDHRLAQWQETVAAIERGQRAPITPAQAEHLQKVSQADAFWKRYQSEECKQVRAKYTNCSVFYETESFWSEECPMREVPGKWLPEILYVECACPQVEGLLKRRVPVDRCSVPTGY